MCFVSVCLLVIGQSGQITQTNNYKNSYIFSLKLFTCDRKHILYHFPNTSCLYGCDYTHSNNSRNENLLSVIHSFCQRLYQFLGKHLIIQWPRCTRGLRLYSRTPLVLEDSAFTQGLRFYSRTPLVLETLACIIKPQSYSRTPLLFNDSACTRILRLYSVTLIVLENSPFVQWLWLYSMNVLVLDDHITWRYKQHTSVTIRQRTFYAYMFTLINLVIRMPFWSRRLPTIKSALSWNLNKDNRINIF